jgi:murein DD-endopeptidase MepM/ murein hydrolase activator NlpD
MKKRNKWTLYFHSSNTKSIRNIYIPTIVFILFLLVFTVSLAGFCRSVKLIFTYAYARYCLYNEKIENIELIKKISFLKKFFEMYENQVCQLINFEDETRLKYGMNSISNDIRQAGIGGKPSLEQLIDKMFDDPVVQNADNLENKVTTLLRQISIQDTTFSRMTNHVKTQFRRWAQTPSIWPVKGRITSAFGYRFHPLLSQNKFHEGIDIGNNKWSPINATADGIISYVGTKRYYGKTVIIDHMGSGYSTVYAHLQEQCVKEGQVVKRGEKVGYLGSTGRSTGPHLHYEVRKLNRHTNPMNYILPDDIIVD